MLTTIITPRFAETDALRHINNAVVPTWFEEGRVGIFEIFNPGLSLDTWNLILRRVEIDYLAQLHIGAPVTIETEVAGLGNTSITIRQRALQRGAKAAEGIAVMVHFDYAAQRPTPIPERIRQDLAPHLA